MKVLVVGNMGYVWQVPRNIFVKPIRKHLSSDLMEGFLPTA